MRPLAGWLLLGITLLHGVFASGLIPILNRHLGQTASLAFSLYFAGILLGQFAIYRFPALLGPRFALSLYEVGFAGSLAFMALLPFSVGLVGGRFLEGLFAGLVLPLLFSSVLLLEGWGSTERRIALFNSANAVGFVVGPILIAGLSRHWASHLLLLAFAGLFATQALLLARSSPPALRSEAGPPDIRRLTGGLNPFDALYTLLFAKVFYGFILAFATSQAASYFGGLGMTRVLLAMSGIFIVGQLAGTVLVPRLHRELLMVHLPLLLAATLLVFHRLDSAAVLFAAMFLQALILFVAYRNVSGKPDNAREFALLNCASDPGMVIGSVLAVAGTDGALGVALLGCVPLVRHVLRPARHTRAELLLPFVGPLTIAKVLKKQQHPVHEPLDPTSDEDRRLTFAQPRTGHHAASLKLLFTGDLGPLPRSLTLDDDLRHLIRQHDVRLINLEGPIATFDEGPPSLWRGFAIPREQVATAITGTDGHEPLFNVVSLLNNHTLDRGGPALAATREHLVQVPGVQPVTNDLAVLEVGGFRIGIVARSFGSNLFWRRHPEMSLLKPQHLVARADVRRKVCRQFSAYREQVDLLILSWHWGFESEYWPAPMQRQAWQILQDAGVDVLYGHHSHIVQPAEIGDDRRSLCLYSCGNFATGMTQPVYRQGALFSVELTGRPDDWRIGSLATHFTALRENADGFRISMIPAIEALAYRNLFASRDRWELSPGVLPAP